MESKANYTMVGLIVLILTAGLLATALWLSVGFNQKQYDTYLVYINEAVSGLSEEAPVKFSGVQVGYVKAINLNNADPQEVRLLLYVEKGTPITTSTTATLISQGITGTSYVGLSASTPDLAPLKKKPGEPYPVIPARPSLFNQLDKVLKDVSDNVNSVSVEIKKVLSPENLENFQKTLQNLEEVTQTVAKNKQRIDEGIKHADEMMMNLAKISKELPELTRELKHGLSQFNRMADSVAKAGDKVSVTMDSGKNAIDKFSNQTLPPAVTLLNRLDTIAANLEKVSNQMRQNPSVILRGTTPPKKGPGE